MNISDERIEPSITEKSQKQMFESEITGRSQIIVPLEVMINLIGIGKLKNVDRTNNVSSSVFKLVILILSISLLFQFKLSLGTANVSVALIALVAIINYVTMNMACFTRVLLEINDDLNLKSDKALYSEYGLLALLDEGTYHKTNYKMAHVFNVFIPYFVIGFLFFVASNAPVLFGFYESKDALLAVLISQEWFEIVRQITGHVITAFNYVVALVLIPFGLMNAYVSRKTLAKSHGLAVRCCKSKIGSIQTNYIITT